MKRSTILALSAIALAACGPSIKTTRVDGEWSDTLAASITDEWVRKDVEMAAADILKQINEHKGFQRYLGSLGRTPKIFVADVQNATSEPYFPIGDLNDEMLNEFSKTGEFILIDAAQRDAILKEVTYQNDGAVDPAQAKNIGKQSGADILVFGDIRMQPKTLDGRTIKDYSVNIRMTDIITGEEVLRTRYKVSKYSKRSGAKW
jgi:PBP1b-binding outer membrane lipoprotein LpoB